MSHGDCIQNDAYNNIPEMMSTFYMTFESATYFGVLSILQIIALYAK